MDDRVDISVLPISYSQVQTQRHLSAFYSVSAPRHPARGRAADALAFYLPRVTSDSTVEKEVNTLFPRLAQQYYKTSGTVTNALRMIIDEMNRAMFQRNQVKDGQGGFAAQNRPGSSFLAFILRHTAGAQPVLFIAQSGLMHLYHITQQGVKHTYDPERSGLGLGVNRATGIYYLQYALAANDFFLLTPTIPPGWDASFLRVEYGKGIENLYRRILAQTSADKENPAPYLLLYTQPGNGLIRPVDLRLESQAAPRQESRPAASFGQDLRPATAVPQPAVPHAPVPATPSATPAEESAGAGQIPNPPGGSDEQIPAKPPFVRSNQPNAWQPFLDSIRSRFAPLYRRLTPPSTRLAMPSTTLPAPLMALVAIIVPVMVVAITSMLYLQRGITSLNQSYYMQAQSLAVQALSEKDMQDRRILFRRSIEELDRAEAYQETAESKALRTYLDSSIDEIDGVVRLDFQPILAGRLAGNVNIKRILIVGGDLYLFNATDGNVIRAEHTGQSFEIDPEFFCGPNPKVGPFIDIAALPWSTVSKRPIVGMDANGGLMYCSLDKEVNANDPESGALFESLVPPDLGWSKPTSIALDVGRLYVLDPVNKAIWVYAKEKDEKTYLHKPTLIFDSRPEITDAMTMALYQDLIYILHQDGHLTKCIYNWWYNQPTRCTDPSPFSDIRTHKEIGPTLKLIDGTPALFSQISFVPPPDPSIYMLEPNTLTVYHLSMVLNLQRQFSAQVELVRARRSATAFAISSDRSVYISIGNNVFGAILP